MAEDQRDDWGFTDADHAELQALLTKHQARARDVLLELMMGDGIGVRPSPDDPGMMGWLAEAVGTNAKVRVFPKGGLQWAFLDRLRELDRDAEKGGA